MKVFDCNTKLTELTAKAFKNAGYEGVIRYVGRTEMTSYDIDALELHTILNSGLSLALVQHCLNPNWIPTITNGALWGLNAAKFAEGVGYQKGCTIYLDLEGINQNVTHQAVIDFCNAWHDACNDYGYVAGVYVGYDCILSSNELYNDLKFAHYWKSFSDVPDPLPRSFEMVQGEQITVNGIEIDPNEAKTDNLGNSTFFMLPPINEYQTMYENLLTEYQALVSDIKTLLMKYEGLK